MAMGMGEGRVGEGGREIDNAGETGGGWTVKNGDGCGREVGSHARVLRGIGSSYGGRSRVRADSGTNAPLNATRFADPGGT